MTIQYIQGVARTAQSGSTPFATWAGNTTTGNLVAVCVFWKNAAVTVLSVADSQGNTYTDSGAGRLNRPTDGHLQIFVAPNITGGTTPTVTVTLSGTPTAGSADVYLVEYSGAATASPVDSTRTGTGTSGTSITTGTWIPGVTAGVVLAFAATNDTQGSAGNIAGSAATVRLAPTNWGVAVEDRIFSSSLGSNITAAVTMSTAFTKGGIIAVVLKEAASDHQTVTPGTKALTLTLFAPTVTATTDEAPYAWDTRQGVSNFYKFHPVKIGRAKVRGVTARTTVAMVWAGQKQWDATPHPLPAAISATATQVRARASSKAKATLPVGQSALGVVRPRSSSRTSVILPGSRTSTAVVAGKVSVRARAFGHATTSASGQSAARGVRNPTDDEMKAIILAARAFRMRKLRSVSRSPIKRI